MSDITLENVTLLRLRCSCGAAYPDDEKVNIKYTNEEKLWKDADNYGWTRDSCPECSLDYVVAPMEEEQANRLVDEFFKKRGYWAEVLSCPSSDWRREVSARDTRQSYRDWVVSKLTTQAGTG